MPTTFYESRDEKFFVGEITHFPFPLHVHEVVEIVHLFSGTVTMEIDGRIRHLSPGDTAVIFPFIPHSYNSISEDVSGLVCIFPPDTISEFSGLFRTRVPSPPVLLCGQADPELKESAARLMSLSSNPNSPLLQAYLHVLLACALSRLEFHAMQDFSQNNLGYRIIHYVSAHAFEPITMESTAREIGISSSHLSHFFSQRMHINFRRFINAIRIDRARIMMHDPEMTLTTLCGACGFSNIRTFRRAFLLETGQLPSEYRHL